MICDHIRNAHTYGGLGDGIRHGLEFLARTDIGALPEGRHDIDGDRVFAIVSDYVSRTPESAFWEAHQACIDIHYVHSGVERVACGDLADFETDPYDTERDLTVARGAAAQLIELRPGSFAILFPHDVHMPGLTANVASAVRKVVVKVYFKTSSPSTCTSSK